MSNIKLGLGGALLRPFTPSRPSSQATQAPIQGQWQKIAANHAAILAVSEVQYDPLLHFISAGNVLVQTTHWPRKSEASVESLVNVIKQVPTSPSPPQADSDTIREPPDANLEQLVSYVSSLLPL